VKTLALVFVISLALTGAASDSWAQTAGSSVVSVTKSELRQVATGCSAKKQFLGMDV
jgi:hypothetical protein